MAEKFYENIREIRSDSTKPGEMGEVYVMIRDVQLRDGRGGRFISFEGFDATGVIPAKKWDCTNEDIAALKNGEKIKMKVTVEDFKGQKNVRVNDYSPISDSDNVSDAHFIVTAPLQQGDMLNYINSMVAKIKDRDIRALVEKIMGLGPVRRSLHFPGGVSSHHAYQNGLLYHIYRILKNIESYMSQNVYGLNMDILIAAAVLHDIGKIREIEVDPVTMAPLGETLEGSALGHILIGVEVVGAAGNVLKTPKDKVMLVKHMIAASHGSSEYGAMRKPMFPEAEMFAMFDMADTRISMYETALAETEKGSMSEWDPGLRRRVYNLPDLVSELEEEAEKAEATEPTEIPA